jgi:hypothetical protein
MILDILTVLFFVLGFALIMWMVVERRRDVLHYVTKSRAARGDVRDDRPDRVVTRKRPSEMRSSMSKAADELSRVVREIERDTSSREEPKANGE